MATNTKSVGVAFSDPQLDGAIIGDTVANGGTAGFYGTTPIAQRSGAAQGTSTVGTASSADVTTGMKAALIEVMNTLTALGLWKGGA